MGPKNEFEESSLKRNSLHVNVKHGGDLEKEEKYGVFEEDCEKKDEEFEEKKDGVEEEKKDEVE